MIVGALVDHRLAFLRGEMGSLQRLARKRLDSMPALMPLGVSVNLVISGALPDDERCRAVLAGFMPDEPDWVQQWWEPDLWARLDACAQLVLDDVLINDDGRLEVAEPGVADAFTTALHAVAMIAAHKFGEDSEHRWVAHWLRRLADTLTLV